jgi:hypothetical protein
MLAPYQEEPNINFAVIALIKLALAAKFSLGARNFFRVLSVMINLSSDNEPFRLVEKLRNH